MLSLHISKKKHNNPKQAFLGLTNCVYIPKSAFRKKILKIKHIGLFGTQFSEDLAINTFPVSLFQKDSCQLMAIKCAVKGIHLQRLSLFQKKCVEGTNILL